MRKRARASSNRSNVNSSSVSSVIGGGSPRAGASRGAADGPPGHRARPNAAATSGDRARGRRNRARIIARDPRVPPAITDPAGSVVRSRATGSARSRVRVAIDAPDRCPPIGSGPRDRAPADGNLARIPERGGGAADRAANRREGQNVEDRARDRAAARGIADDQGRMFLGEVNGEAVDLDRGIEVESHDPSRTTAMVRSRHIDTGIEVRTCS